MKLRYTFLSLLFLPTLSWAALIMPELGTINFNPITLLSAYQSQTIYKTPFNVTEDPIGTRPINITAQVTPSCTDSANKYAQCMVNQYDPSAKIYYSIEYQTCASSFSGIKVKHLTHSGIKTYTNILYPAQLTCSPVQGQLGITRLAKINTTGSLTPITAGPYHASVNIFLSEI